MELVYKILHIPTGKFVTSPYVYQGWKTKDWEADVTKKGRAWKRWCDVLVAWKTLKKSMTEKGNPRLTVDKSNLIEDYRIQIFSLQLVDTMDDAAVMPEIKEREEKWKQQKIKDEIYRLNWRISEYSKKKHDDETYLETMKKELAKLTKDANK